MVSISIVCQLGVDELIVGVLRCIPVRVQKTRCLKEVYVRELRRLYFGHTFRRPREESEDHCGASNNKRCHFVIYLEVNLKTRN
jgi:hypothetical protein